MILDSILESALGGVLILQAVRDGMDNITDFDAKADPLRALARYIVGRKH